MEGIIIIKDKSNIINWHDNNQSFYIQGNVDNSTLLDVAESILKKINKKSFEKSVRKHPFVRLYI